MAFDIVDENTTKSEILALVQNVEYIEDVLNMLLVRENGQIELDDINDNLAYVYEQVLIGLYGGQTEQMKRPKVLQALLDILPNSLSLCRSSKEIVDKERYIAKKFGLDVVDDEARESICNAVCGRIKILKKYYAGDPIVLDLAVWQYGTPESVLAAIVRTTWFEEVEEQRMK